MEDKEVDRWKPYHETPKFEDFPVAVVIRNDNGNASLTTIEEAHVPDSPPTYNGYTRKSWELICEWHNIVAWKSVHFKEVNKDTGLYLNLNPYMTWT